MSNSSANEISAMIEPRRSVIMPCVGYPREEGDSGAIQEPADLGLAVGLVRRFEWVEAILQPGIERVVHAWLTSRACCAVVLAVASSFFSVRSIRLNSFVQRCCVFWASANTAVSF